ncbi:MAG: prolipoprotein diacylglyceryl transferase [Polyangiaceae bacterium]|nr:prolipoprotein diacylglyceryl transferase [Polyangiaceae bacterium]
MHPILFRLPIPNWNIPGIGSLHETFVLGSIPFYSYGIMLGLSLVVGWYLTLWLAEKDGLPKETMANCYVITAIAAIVGGRLFYVITNLDEFHSMADILALRRGGLVAYGGFIGGYLGSWIYLRTKKIPLMPWADVAVPSLASGLLITRIGCYLFGCDFGRPLSENAPGFLKTLGSFPHWDAGIVDHGDGAPAWSQHLSAGLIRSDATHSLPVHPTQLYESLFGLLLLGLLLYQRKHLRFRGQVFMLFAFVYGAGRFLLETVRDDPERGLMGPSVGAHILIAGCLALFAIAYSVGFASIIRNMIVRRTTQALSFIPAIVVFIAMRPASYAHATDTQLSTSQWVGLITAIAVAIAFFMFAKTAEAHPAGAMAIDLKDFYSLQAKSEADKSEADKSENDEEPAEPTAKKPRTGKKKSKKKAATADESESGDTAGGTTEDGSEEPKHTDDDEPAVPEPDDDDAAEDEVSNSTDDETGDEADVDMPHDVTAGSGPTDTRSSDVGDAADKTAKDSPKEAPSKKDSE